MNEGIIVIVLVGLIAVAYFMCAFYRNGTCDMGKCLTLLFVVVGLFTGTMVVIRACASIKTKTPYEDAVWSAVAGIILGLSSFLQIITMFRELFVKKVAPATNEASR